jgi:hypothetical protein
MASALLVGMLLGWGLAGLIRVGLRNHRRFVSARAVDGLALRSYLVGVGCLLLAAWILVTVGYFALTGSTP